MGAAYLAALLLIPASCFSQGISLRATNGVSYDSATNATNIIFKQAGATTSTSVRHNLNVFTLAPDGWSNGEGLLFDTGSGAVELGAHSGGGLTIASGGNGTFSGPLLTFNIATGAYSNTTYKIQEVGGSTNVGMLINCTNLYFNGMDGTFRHIAITAFSSIATSSDGAFGGLRKGTQLYTLINSGQYEIFQIKDANTAIIHQVNQGFWTLPQGSVATTTNWYLGAPPIQMSDNVIGGGLDQLSHQFNWIDNGGQPTYGGIDDNGLVTIADAGNSGTGTVLSMGMLPVANEHPAFRNLPGEVLLGFGGVSTNSHFQGGLGTYVSFWIDSMAINDTMGIFSDNNDTKLIHMAGILTNLDGTSITVGSQLKINAGFNSSTTNTLIVTSTGLTNNTTSDYLVAVTAGTGLAVKDGNGNQFLAPVLNDTFPLKPGWRFTGTAVTGIAVQFP